MNIKRIAIDKLVAHPANSNVMSEELLVKLRRHIARHGNYEPLVVRPHPEQAGHYQLINGHHRKLVLARMGHKHADCVVWDISDDETLMLLATVNRLSGQDDPKKRAQLLAVLAGRFKDKELLRNLPEKRHQLQKILSLNQPAKMVQPEKIAELPQALTFFVNKNQKKIIEQGLGRIKKQLTGDDPQSKPTRGDLLAIMADKISG